MHEDDDLVELLAELQLDEEIPEALYRVVAEIIAFVEYRKGGIPRVMTYRVHDDDIRPLRWGESANIAHQPFRDHSPRNSRTSTGSNRPLM